MTKFNPKYTITSSMMKNLLQIENVKEEVKNLPVNPRLLISLRKTARISTIHYSTQIEGNRLSHKEVDNILTNNVEIKNRVRDEKEIRGYYAALDFMDKTAKQKTVLKEDDIKILHGYVTGGGKKTVKPTPWRSGQNVITDSLSGKIVYMPPEAKDVPDLMKNLVDWINEQKDIPIPIKAGIVHYQFVTIHPYFDGNGRTARILTTLILHKNGYGLKGIYSLEEYYAKNLQGYYEALTIGKSHNYYLGRINADITKWLEFFISGMAEAFNSVYKKAKEYGDLKDETTILRELDVKQKQILELFEAQKFVTSKDVACFFKFTPRSARLLLKKWSEEEFILIQGEGKQRKYRLTDKYEEIFK